MKRIFILLALCCLGSPLLLTPTAAPAATIVWDGSENNDWSEGLNWAGGTKPGTSDIAHFDGVSDVDCTVDEAVSVQGIQVDAGYAGDIDTANFAITIEPSGSSGLILRGTGTFDAGSSTITFTGSGSSGAFSYIDQADNGTLDWGTSTISLGAAGVTVTGDYASALYRLTNTSGNTMTIDAATDSRVDISNLCTINGPVVLDAVLAVTGDGDFVLNDGASFSGASYLYLVTSTSGHGLTTLHSNVTTPEIRIWASVAGTKLAAGSYEGLVKLLAQFAGAPILELDNGTYTFASLELENSGTGTMELRNKTNDPTINVTNVTIDLDSTGNILIDDDGQSVTYNVSGNIVDEDSGGGAFSWTQGTGTKSFIGTGDQVIGTAAGGGLSIGEWAINKPTSGEVALDNITMVIGPVNIVGDGSEAFVVGANAGCTITSTADAKTFTGATANSADCNFSAAGNDVNLGSATWTVTNGDWVTIDAGTWNTGTSTVVLDGTCGINTGATNDLYNLTVDGTVTGDATNDTEVNNVLTVNGTLSVPTNRNAIAKGTVVLNDGSRVTGAGTLRFPSPGAAEGLTTFHSGATLDIANITVLYPNAASVFRPGTYDSAVRIYNDSASAYTVTLDAAGTYVFTSFEIDNASTGSITLANNTNGPASITINGNLLLDDRDGTITVNNSGVGTDWVLVGDVAVTGSGTFNWTAGTAAASITASGTSAQDWDWAGKTIEALVVNKSAETLTFSGAWTAASFTLTDGSVDFGGQTVITTGNFSVSPGATFATGGAGLDGANISVSGNFNVTGTDATDIDMTATAWALDVTGAAQCRYVNATNSDASAGSTVYALGSVDGGSNSNWIFVPRGAETSRMRRHPPRMGHSRW